MHLTIGWLYAASMNIYGDRGNVIALKRRAEWRGIPATVREINIGEPIPGDIDCFFWGGGQDQEQAAVARDLQGAKGKDLAAAIEDGASLLAVCGGYQLLGHEYRPHAAEVLPGVGIIDAVSVAGPERFIGNVVIDSEWGTLVGFENHSGLTTLGPNLQPMGKVRVGRGNNGKDGTEGARYRNALGCYLHGALLPKNPVLTDWLIARGLERRHGPIELAPINDGLEQQAHATAVERAVATR
ncbi:MAG: glutamine amidotransferase [Thermomicrobiales bacterium]|nr:glutamine amidotransferase [Thermomicrobiales bacterium]